jgi:hypothetical protein
MVSDRYTEFREARELARSQTALRVRTEAATTLPSDNP